MVTFLYLTKREFLQNLLLTEKRDFGDILKELLFKKLQYTIISDKGVTVDFKQCIFNSLNSTEIGKPDFRLPKPFFPCPSLNRKYIQ